MSPSSLSISPSLSLPPRRTACTRVFRIWTVCGVNRIENGREPNENALSKCTDRSHRPIACNRNPGDPSQFLIHDRGGTFASLSSQLASLTRTGIRLMPMRVNQSRARKVLVYITIPDGICLACFGLLRDVVKKKNLKNITSAVIRTVNKEKKVVFFSWSLRVCQLRSAETNEGKKT